MFCEVSVDMHNYWTSIQLNPQSGGEAGANPGCLLARGEVHPGQVANLSQG